MNGELPEVLLQPEFKDLYGLAFAVEEDGVYLLGVSGGFAMWYRHVVHTSNLTSLAPHAHRGIRVLILDADAHGDVIQGHGISQCCEMPGY